MNTMHGMNKVIRGFSHGFAHVKSMRFLPKRDACTFPKQATKSVVEIIDSSIINGSLAFINITQLSLVVLQQEDIH